MTKHNYPYVHDYPVRNVRYYSLGQDLDLAYSLCFL